VLQDVSRDMIWYRFHLPTPESSRGRFEFATGLGIFSSGNIALRPYLHGVKKNSRRHLCECSHGGSPPMPSLHVEFIPTRSSATLGIVGIHMYSSQFTRVEVD
jgi:hypothetical protein